MEIGIQLRKLRIANGYSQQYVANYLQISRNSYIAWESNGAQLTISKLEQLCELYEITVHDLFDRERVKGVTP